MNELDEMLKKWDEGDCVSSIELGGLGPGYEQAIQIAAIEFARVCKNLEGIKSDDKESTERFRKACNERLKEIDEDLGGLSGAQMGQAIWLAFQWCFNGGPEALVKRAEDKGEGDRRITISRHWPKADFKKGAETCKTNA